MKYRVSYKRYFETINKLALVDEDLELSHFKVSDMGALILYEQKVDDVQPVIAIPPGLWILIEPTEKAEQVARAAHTPTILEP